MGNTLLLKKADIQKLNLERAFTHTIYRGNMATNLEAKTPIIMKNAKGEELNCIIDAEKAEWVGTKAYKQHWNKIENLLEKIRKEKDDLKLNVAQFPDDYYELIEAISIDITRMRFQEIDYTALLTNEVIRQDFSKSVDLQEFLDFVGEFQENNLAGDSVPLLEQKTGAKDAVQMKGYALGHVRSLEDVLYNLSIYSIQKVNRAFTRAYIGKRNDICFGPMIAITDAAGWNAGQTVAADATSGATIEEKVYKTVNATIEALGKLYDFQTGQEIDLTRIVFALGPNVDVRSVNRAIRGQLQNSKGVNSNREPLEVDQIWQYKGDSFTYGKKKITYKGIASKKGYAFVPGPAGAPTWTLTKRELTSVSSPGDAANLSQEKNSKYFIQTEYNDEWYGSSSSNTTITGNTDHVWGYIVEFNLP